MKDSLSFYTPVSTRVRLGFALGWLVMAFIAIQFVTITAIPTAAEVYYAFVRLSTISGTENLFYNTLTTLYLQVSAIVVSVLISAGIVYVGRINIFAPVSKFVQILRYIPILGFTLIFYSFFSIGFQMKLAMLTVGLVFFLTKSMSAVIDEISEVKYDLAKSLGYNDWQIFTSVVFFPTLPAMINAVMQNSAMGWLMTTSVETFNRTDGGIGSQLYMYSSSNQTANVYVYLIMIGFIALLQDGIFRLINKSFFSYYFIKERG